MDHGEAVAMLSPFGAGFLKRKKWADLGCGSGTFTLALADLLPKDTSHIHAVDSDHRSLSGVPGHYNKVFIEKHKEDFVADEFSFDKVQGVLMANSLHFVQDKQSFLNKLKAHLEIEGCVLLVEYDLVKPNPWVPYPLTFDQTKKMFNDAGFQTFRKLNERPSRYNRSQMYSAVALASE